MLISFQAKNPKYIRYLAAETEGELNKWVTGIRIAKYGKGLYENFRGIVEQMAHDDIDQIAASSRLSVHDVKSNSPGQGFDDPHRMSHHHTSNSRMMNSGHQHKGNNVRPIILADKAKVHGNSLPSNTNYQPQKETQYDRNIVEVSLNYIIKGIIKLNK